MEPKQVLNQFQSINRIRIERLRELAPKSQQDFFDLLALLFHINAEDLPGYISDDTPAGIVDYQPNNITIDAAKALDPHFNLKRRPLRHYPLLGVYLINDHGSLHYPESAKFELWLVHSTSSTQAKQLQQKLNAVEEWAGSLKINLHTRLLSEQSLSQQSISAEDLNRFYLNGLVLAGSAPLWWAISPEQEESNYEQTAKSLIQQRLFGYSSIIDFGPLREADASLLLTNTSQLLLVATEQGLEPLLELIHYQHQLTTFTAFSWLSKQLKQAVYQGERDPLFLDANILKLRVLMDDSAISEQHQLLAQQSLYIAFNEHLSKRVSRPQYPWRRAVITQLVSSWQWPQHHIQTLDQRQNSTYRQYQSEFQLVSQFHLIVRKTMADFAKKHTIDIREQNTQLDQKHQLFHDIDPNIIPSLPGAFLPHKNKDTVYLHRFNSDSGWFINDIALNSANEQSLFKAHTLLQVITWAVRNHVLTQPSQLKVADQTEQISTHSAIKLVQQLLRSPFAEEPPIITSASLDKTPECNQVMLFINLEHEGPQDKLTQQGLVRSSLQNDPLSHAIHKQNLIFSVEGLIQSSWGQWHYFSHTGNTAVLEMFNTILLWQPTHSPAKLTLCWCPSDSHGKSIEIRLSTLFNDVIAHYKNNPDNGDYLISISESYYQIEWQPGSCDFKLARKGQKPLDLLGNARSHFSTTKVDSYLDPSDLLNSILRFQSPKQLTLFLSLKKKIITIYLLDEQGILFHQSFSELSESTLINHFYRFLENIKQQNTIERLRFYRLTKTRDNNWKVSALPLTNLSQQEYLPVSIEMSSTDNNAQCTIHCGSKKFSGKADDQTLFKQVNELVLNLRKSNAQYPLYITQLSFPNDARYESYHYIAQKQRLEELLNKR